MLYAHVENGSITYQGTLPKTWRNISGLNLSEGDNSFLKPLGWLPVIETNVTPDSNEVFDSDEVTINEDKVQIFHRVRDMTVEELTVRDRESWRSMREIRNTLLSETDWWASSDLNITQDQKDYRQALRDLPANTSDPTNITWPEKPE